MARTTFFLGRVAVIVAAGWLAQPEFARAAPTNPEDIIEGRRSNLRDLGGAYREILEELKKAAPMKFLMEQYANQLSDLSNDLASWFPAGSGPEAGFETMAKAEIWTDPADFKRASEELKVEAANLAKIAGGTDKAAIAAQIKATVVYCKVCHDKYKTSTEHDFKF